jgi:predicted  nucleic acid-binding Zn-ribbon protein
MDKNAPATKKDILDLEGRFDIKIAGLDTKIDGLDTKIDGLETKLKDDMAELVRDAQTEILRGFVAFQNSNGPRMRKMEADLSNIDAATSQRLEVLEQRMLEVEKKLIMGNR